MKLRYTGRARNDLIISFEWYEKQRRGLGFEFLDCVEAVIETIQQMPKLYAKRQSKARKGDARKGGRFIFQEKGDGFKFPKPGTE